MLLRRLLAAVLLLVGIVLSPLRAVAATVPMLIGYEATVGLTATTRVETGPSPRPGRGGAPEYAYDNVLEAGGRTTDLPVVAGTQAIHAYDGAFEPTERRGVAEGG